MFLKKLLFRIKKFSTGPIGGTEVVKEVGLFSFHYNVFVHESGLFERERRGILDLNSHLEALLNELKGEWNTTRKAEVVLGAKDHEKDRNLAMEEVPKNEGKRGVKRKKKTKAPFSTPKKYCTIMYQPATPKEEGEKIKCNFCIKEFESGKALKKHCKLKHPDEVFDFGKEKDSQYRVSCKLCYGNKLKYAKDQIARHIALVHNIQKPNSKATFKGWMSGNGTTWKPVFLASYEQDPPPTMEVEVHDDMDLSYFGHILKPGEYMCHTTDDLTGVNDDNIDCEESGDENHSPQPGSSKMCPADMNTCPKLFQSDQGENQSMEINPIESMDGEKIDMETGHSCPLEEDVGKHSSLAVSRKLFDEVNDDNIQLIEDIQRDEAFPVNNTEDENEGSDEVDSDYEDGDGEQFTSKRISRKADRQENRSQTQQNADLVKLENNSRIINRFEKYMNNKKMNKSQNPSKLSTLKKHNGHLFTYHDSLLSFESNKDPLFNLERLTNPLSNEFLELADPTAADGWLHSMAGESGKELPRRRTEALKAHARFRDFLYDELFRTDFGNDTRDLLKRNLVLKRLKKISTQIKNDSVFRSLGDLAAAETNEIAQAKKTLYPNNDHNEATSVVKWFKSKEAEEEEKRCMDIYDKGMGSKELTSKEFDKFAIWSRFTVCLEDRNRQGAYSFKNIDYMRRSPKWLPKKKRSDKRTDVEILDRLPQDWDPDQPPIEGEKPSVWTISVSGKDNALKGNQSVDIVLTRRGEEICQRYRELKFVCLDEEKEDDHFFVNMKGKPLGPIQNVPGSLLEKLGAVCGIQNATVTSFRRAAEGKVQSSSVMKEFSKQIQHHSADVGRNYYDKTGTNTRASFVYQVSEIESPKKSADTISEDVLEMRVTRQRNDRATVLKKAKSVLEDDKLKKMIHRSKKNQILYKEREFLKPLLLDDYLPIKRNRLPGKIKNM